MPDYPAIPRQRFGSAFARWRLAAKRAGPRLGVLFLPLVACGVEEGPGPEPRPVQPLVSALYKHNTPYKSYSLDLDADGTVVYLYSDDSQPPLYGKGRWKREGAELTFRWGRWRPRRRRDALPASATLLESEEQVVLWGWLKLDRASTPSGLRERGR